MKKLKKTGFTLVELLIGMSILAAMVTILVGIVNPIALIGKAHDARKKDDLNKVKIAFEEYYNDKKIFPLQADINNWDKVTNCNKAINDGSGIGGYLKILPCDPNGKLYVILTTKNTFRVVTNLENKADNSIPAGWYDLFNNKYPSPFDKNKVNYGVSSSNINWYEYVLDTTCSKSFCSKKKGNGQCDTIPYPNVCDSSDGQCYFSDGCEDNCAWSCCGPGCNTE